MNINSAAEKSKAFSVRMLKLAEYLRTEKKSFEVASQVLRSGTSIGANIAESESAITKADFANKIHIALKEARETAYWLDILYKAGVLSKREFDSINGDCEELIKILQATVNTLKRQKNNSLSQ